MSNSEFIIPRRYGGVAVTNDIDPALLQKHMLPFGLATCGMHELFQQLLQWPTQKFLQHAQASGKIDIALLQGHAAEFPRNYQMPKQVSSYLLPMIYDKVLQSYRASIRGGQFFNPAPSLAIMRTLLRIGANAFVLLTQPEITAKDMDDYLSCSPQGTSHTYKGWTLAHARWRDEDFITAKLPVLMKHRVDINAVTEEPNIGTLMHFYLANEESGNALVILRAPSTRDKIDPRRIDGEGKTIPIIAAKTLAENVLLELANLYPSRLALDAQDKEGRSVMHYIFAFGLVEAARRYMEFKPNLELKDNLGRTPVDYLDLDPTEISDILKSIEIHPDRDAGAKRNAILGQIKPVLPVMVDGNAQMTKAENFTQRLGYEVRRQFGLAGIECVMAQYDQLQNRSLLSVILERREQLKHEYTNGLLAPNKTGVQASNKANSQPEPE